MDMPADLVTLESIKKRFYRALTPDEERIAEAWVEDAWDELMDLEYLRLQERLNEIPPESGLLKKIGRVIRAAVLNRLRNPQGRRQYSYSVDDATVSETIASETIIAGWFTDEDLAKLQPSGFSSDAFSVRIDAHVPDPPAREGWPWTSR